MSDSRLPNLKPHTVWMMAIASGAAVANLYYNQPLLAVIAQSLHASARAVGLIPVLTQVGYASWGFSCLCRWVTCWSGGN